MNWIGKIIFNCSMKGFTPSQKQHALFVERCFDCMDRNLDPNARHEFKRENEPLEDYLNPVEMIYVSNWIGAWHTINKKVNDKYE